jgi:hypothetical protein
MQGWAAISNSTGKQPRNEERIAVSESAAGEMIFRDKLEDFGDK